MLKLSIKVPREPIGTPCGRLSFIKKIGQGGEGGVWLAESSTSQQCAVKVINCDGAYERYMMLRNSFKAIKHPYIVPVKRVMWEAAEGRAFVCMELCDGDLQQLIVRSPEKRLQERQAVRYSRQAISALRHFHKQGLSHGDIKSDNLLYKRNSDVIKLCDFGSLTLNGRGHSPLSGSLSYMAPECFHCSSNSVFDPISADMWSLGITIYTMVAGDVPWSRAHSDDPMFLKFCDSQVGDANRFPSYFSTELMDLLNHLLVIDAAGRYSATEASEHEWIVSNQSVDGNNLNELIENEQSNISEINKATGSKRNREDAYEDIQSTNTVGPSAKRLFTSSV